MKRFLFPSGTVLAVLGVDGAGKSTLIDSIKPALKDATHKAVFYEHLRPNLLPPLARLKGVKTINGGPVIDPHGSAPSGFLGSLFRITYLITDYIAGYWLKIRPLIAKRPAIVIFDRYAYDMAFDQRRFRLNLPSWLVCCFASLAPKPDLIFCLYGAPEVLAARKKELPLAEVTRQVNALKAFAANEPRAIMIDTEQSIEACRDQILQSISAYCSERASR
jgi:thymidylate kinase